MLQSEWLVASSTFSFCTSRLFARQLDGSSLVVPQHSGSIEPAYAIGVEIGTRGLRVALCQPDGSFVDTLHAINPLNSANQTVDTLYDLIDNLRARHPEHAEHLTGVGIAFGGPVDTNRGITIASPRIRGFEDFPLAGIVQDRYRIPVLVENDARAAALGEYEHGAGRGARSMIYMQLGIGVGGGVIIDGRLHHGSAMTAGEFGHMPVTPDGPRCSCGKPGHLEAYVSETAILERLRDRLEHDSYERPDWPDLERTELATVFNRMNESPIAADVASEAIKMIGLALANLVTALSFDSVVLGGYAIELGPTFVASVRARIRQFAFDAPGRRVSVATAQLGQQGALIGATGLMFRRNHHEDGNHLYN